MTNWINQFEAPYTEDNVTLNNFVDDLIHQVSWRLFKDQEQVVFMAYETENNLPIMKDGIIEHIGDAVNRELGWLRQYIITRILVGYMKENITANEEVYWWFQDELDEENYDEFVKEIDRYIWNDYAKFLGEDRTAELWEKWGKEPLN